MGDNFNRLEAAAIDGRAHNVFYRQEQLQSLCQRLLENAETIREAIMSDYGHTQSEVAVEFNLALSAVKNNYTSLQPKDSHEAEYAIANGKDSPDRRVPVGIVCIEPTAHTMFYSTIVPLSAALAAGNCVVVVLGNNLRALPNLLRRLLQDALSADTFAIASSPVVKQHLVEHALFVNQSESKPRWPKANQLVSLSQSRAVALVDRTADLRQAAKELVSARLAFGGRSPYAPDIVLVNEFAKKGFLQAVVSECVSSGSDVETDETPRKSTSGNRVDQKVEALKQSVKGVRVIVQQNKIAVVELPERLQTIPEDKNGASVLVVCSTRSLDDAIDLLGRSSSDPYLAAYHFSNLPSAKYLAQFVDAATSFVNHIPRDLLVGPAFPVERPIRLDERYPTAVFEFARPALANPSTNSMLLASALSSSSNASAQDLWNAAISPLAVMNRSKGGAVGFFEQGFLMNAALLLTTTLAVSSTGAWYLWRHSRR